MDDFSRAAIHRARSALDLADSAPATGFLSGRFLKSLGLTSNRTEAVQFASAQSWCEVSRIKSALSSGDVGSGDLAAVMADFWDVARPMSVLGRLPGLVLRPFRQKAITPTTGAIAAFHAEGDAIPVSGLRFALLAGLHERFVTAIDVATREALQRTAGLDRFIAIPLARSLATEIDREFLDPNNDGSGAAPRSITHATSSDGAIHVPATGDAKADFEALFSAYAGDLTTAALVMHPLTAVGLAFTAADWGDTELGARGGRVLGLPAICSESVPMDSSGGLVVLVDVGALDAAAEVTVLDSSDQGTIEMTNPPTGNSITPTGSQTVSLWQTGSVAFKATAVTDWAMRRPGSVAVLTAASYAGS